MRITVNEVEISSTEAGYPFWFEIRDGDRAVSFTNKDAKAIYDALGNCIEEVERLQKWRD